MEEIRDISSSELKAVPDALPMGVEKGPEVLSTPIRDGRILMGDLIGWDKVAELAAGRAEAKRMAARLRHNLGGNVSVALSHPPLKTKLLLKCSKQSASSSPNIAL